MAVQCKGMIDSSGIFYKEIYVHKNTLLKGEDESVVDFSYGMGVSEFTVEIFGSMDRRKHCKSIKIEHERIT